MPRQVGFLADQRTMVQDAELAKGLALRDNVDRRASPAARGSRCVQSAAVSAAPVGESMPSIKCCGWQRSSLHPPRKGVRQGVRQDEPGSVARRRNIPCGVAVEWAEKTEAAKQEAAGGEPAGEAAGEIQLGERAGELRTSGFVRLRRPPSRSAAEHSHSRCTACGARPARPRHTMPPTAR